MADWTGAARSNRVLIKDMEGLRLALASWPIEISIDEDGPPNRVCLLSEDEYGGWPSLRQDDDSDEDIEFDFAELVCPYLEEGQILVVMESGAERLRYITGFAAAYDHRGEAISISLRNIYELASVHFKVPQEGIAPCEY